MLRAAGRVRRAEPRTFDASVPPESRPPAGGYSHLSHPSRTSPAHSGRFQAISRDRLVKVVWPACCLRCMACPPTVRACFHDIQDGRKAAKGSAMSNTEDERDDDHNPFDPSTAVPSEIPAGVDRRKFIMRSAVISAAAVMNGCSRAETEQTAPPPAAATAPPVAPPERPHRLLSRWLRTCTW